MPARSGGEALGQALEEGLAGGDLGDRDELVRLVRLVDAAGAADDSGNADLLLEQAGFELVAASEMNANPLDKPGVDDGVWRLPPTLRTSKDNPELRAAMESVGESDRMTLLFRKAPQ